MSSDTVCGLDMLNSQSLSHTLTLSFGSSVAMSLRTWSYISAERLLIMSLVILVALFGVPATLPPVFFPIAI